MMRLSLQCLSSRLQALRELCTLKCHYMYLQLYTSGSTGKPKGVEHTTAGYMVGASTTFKYVFDHRPSDIYWCTADCGWITGHSYVTYGEAAFRHCLNPKRPQQACPVAAPEAAAIQIMKLLTFYTCFEGPVGCYAAGPMLNGATQVLFEGVPTYPDAGRAWDIVDKYKVQYQRRTPFLHAWPCVRQAYVVNAKAES